MGRTMLLDGFVWTAESWGAGLRSSPLGRVADHFFTTRQLWLRGGSEAADWASVAAAIGVPEFRLLRLTQVHGCGVLIHRVGDEVGGLETGTPRRAVEDDASESFWPEADILVTDDPSVALAVVVADCVPLLIADPRSGAVAAVHAGWRGTAAGAAPAAVAAMVREFGARPERLVVAEGPSIGPCCYTVGAELIDAFVTGGFAGEIDEWFTRDATGGLRLDLWAANRDQLMACGVPGRSIHRSGLCTASHPEWFASYRRDGPGTGRIAAVIRSRGAR
jgi:purine-nucleoside/S-methyl-5'-thioadenosine phosphorylase / adenosine deaminase